ncbi:MAG: type II secretion system protein [Patescibacteria group bacterium]
MDKNKRGFIPHITNLCGGFTLWEILIAIGLMGILFSLGLIFSMDFYRQKILGAERETIAAVLKRARNEAQNNVNQSNHGVYFGLSLSYVIFQGNTYASRNNAYDEIFSRTGGMNLTGPDELTFSSLDAGSSVSGTISVSNGIKSLDIGVNSEGRIDW